MKKKIKDIAIVVVALLLSSLVFLIPHKKEYQFAKVNKVYLKGEEVGYLKEGDDLNKYINKLSENEILKEKYDVDKVSLPSNVYVEKAYVKNPQYTTMEQIHERIKSDTVPTIKGYKVTVMPVTISIPEVKGETRKAVFYIRDKKILDKAIDEYIKLFTTEEEYNSFFKKKDTVIVEDKVEKVINNIKIANNIKIVEANIPVDEKIYTDVESLNSFLLYGDDFEAKEHIVKKGEDVEDVAEKAKMSVSELILINEDLKSEDQLLYPGQKLNTSFMKPSLVVEKETVETTLLDKDYELIIEYDKTKNTNYEKVKQNGEKGQYKTIYKYVYYNNSVSDFEKISIETLKQSKNKIVIRGTKKPKKPTRPPRPSSPYTGNYKPYIGEPGSWVFPTVKPSVIVYSEWGYRTYPRGFHEGIDYASKGKKKLPIYAAKDGVVVEVKRGISEYTTGLHLCGSSIGKGNYVYIDHGNVWTTYLHLSSVKSNIKVGQKITRGTLIGYMGKTGCANGVHLHFGISKVYPYSDNNPRQSTINPRKVFG